MTLTDLVRALLRRWPIVALGLVLTIGFAYLSTLTQPTFHARTEVVFLAPTSLRNPNELVTSSESVIITAGAVMKRINGAEPALQFNSQMVNPVGSPDTGENTWIRLLDAGNQWVSNFDDQVLLVDAVGSTREEAERRILAASDRIGEELASLQVDQGTDPINYISTRMSPESPAIREIGGSGVRSAGMTLLIGFLATVALTVVLEVGSQQNRSSKTTIDRVRRGRRRGTSSQQTGQAGHADGADPQPLAIR